MKAPMSRPYVPKAIRCEPMRFSSAQIVRSIIARRGISSPMSFSTAIE